MVLTGNLSELIARPPTEAARDSQLDALDDRCSALRRRHWWIYGGAIALTFISSCFIGAYFDLPLVLGLASGVLIAAFMAKLLTFDAYREWNEYWEATRDLTPAERDELAGLMREHPAISALVDAWSEAEIAPRREQLWQLRFWAHFQESRQRASA